MNPPGQSSQHGIPRRTNTYSGQHDELHISGGGAQGAREYGKLEPASAQPGGSPYHHQQSPSNVPNVLQPAGGLSSGSRPSATSANTAPQMPTMSGGYQHQSMSPNEYTSPSKPPQLSMSHSYSRSSPATGYDGSGSGGYSPYAPTTPGGSSIAGPSQYMSPPDPKHGTPGSQRNISNAPLGLADIRPRADSSLSDGQQGTAGYELANVQASASNYVAPWALYAFDWCKWAPQGKGAGKVAIGSYLEDGHNFVSC